MTGGSDRDPLSLGGDYELVDETAPRIPWGRTGARVGVIQSLYASDLSNRPSSQCFRFVADEIGLNGKQRQFGVGLLDDVERFRDRSDGYIGRFAVWSASEASEVVLRNVLRVAFAELINSDPAMVPIVINEAVSVAKLLTTDGGGRFVNGVLGAAVRELGDDLRVGKVAA